MLVESVWVETNAVSAELAAVATSLGGGHQPISLGNGRQYRIGYTFSDSHESEWEVSQSKGTWHCAVIELADVAANERTDRLVGVIGPRTSLVDTLVEQLGDGLHQQDLACEVFDFPLAPLLGDNAIDAGLHPVSVRMRGEGSSALVKADDWPQLRAVLAAVGGDLAGITLRARGEVFSVLPGGSIVFEDPSASGIVDAVTAVRQAMLVPEY